jgi:hypothetical protein
MPQGASDDATIEIAIAGLVRRIPETWTDFDRDSLTETEERALFLLVAAAMVEKRMAFRLRFIGHPIAVHATVTATGEYGFAEAMEQVAAGAWQQWRVELEHRPSNETPAFLCERLGIDQWRLTHGGVQARGDLEAGDPAPVFDFVLKRGFFDGEPRLLPGGRVSRREPVRGRGRGERLEFLTSEKLDSDGAAVAVNNWPEGAAAIAAALAPFLSELKPRGASPAIHATPSSSSPASAIARLVTLADEVTALFDAMMGGYPDQDSVKAAADVVFVDHPNKTERWSGLPRLTFCGDVLPIETWTAEQWALTERWSSHCAMTNAICLAYSAGARGRVLARRVLDTYCGWAAIRERLLDPATLRTIHADVVAEAQLWGNQAGRVASRAEAVVTGVRRLSEPDDPRFPEEATVMFRGTWHVFRAEHFVPAVEALRPYSRPTRAGGAPPTTCAGDAEPIAQEIRFATPQFMGLTALANALGVPDSKKEAFRRKLERVRLELGDDGFHEVRDPPRNAEKYLYNASHPQIQKLATKYRD